MPPTPDQQATAQLPSRRRRLHPETRRILAQLATHRDGVTSRVLSAELYGSANGAAVSNRLNGLAAKQLVALDTVTGIWRATDAGRGEVSAAPPAAPAPEQPHQRR
jgi:hypothetical protein